MPTREELPEFVRNHQLGKLARRTEPVYTDEGDLTDKEEKHVASEGDYDADTEFVDDPADAEVVLSLIPAEVQKFPDVTKHRPIIDIDFPVVVLPSSTSGHNHLYIDKVLTWRQYQRLIEALADAGIIENGYRDASLARQFTSVRMPSVNKIPPQPVAE